MNVSDFDTYLRQVSTAVDHLDRGEVMAFAETLLEAWQRGATVYALGNGLAEIGLGKTGGLRANIGGHAAHARDTGG